MAGIAFTYVFSPMLDDFYNRFSLKPRKIVCGILIAIFLVDLAFSIVHPNSGEGITMADMLASSLEYASDRKMDFDSLCTDLNQVLSCILNERERTIVVQSFGIGCPECSLDDIGYNMGLTRERVRQIRERGLEKIRKHPQSRLLLKHVA